MFPLGRAVHSSVGMAAGQESRHHDGKLDAGVEFVRLVPIWVSRPPGLFRDHVHGEVGDVVDLRGVEWGEREGWWAGSQAGLGLR